MEITYEWRRAFETSEVERLHAEGFGHEPSTADDWWPASTRTAWAGSAPALGRLSSGSSTSPWDGCSHAFVLDTVVAITARHAGVGRRMIEVAADHARAADCEWVHVDFDEHLGSFYFDSCGFAPTAAGLIRLRDA